MSDDTDWRAALADAIAITLQRSWPTAEITQTVTTSGCPVIKVKVAGQSFNCTITRARK